jgi:hypothetical protein
MDITANEAINDRARGDFLYWINCYRRYGVI